MFRVSVEQHCIFTYNEHISNDSKGPQPREIWQVYEIVDTIDLSLRSWPIGTGGHGIVRCPVPKEGRPRLRRAVGQMYYSSVGAAVLNICE